MSRNKINVQVTQKEREILDTLWKEDRPLIASDIAKLGNELSINTVQTALKSLMKKKLIEVAEIVYSGTVLSRSYRPTTNRADFIQEDMHNYFEEIEKHISPIGIINTLLDHEKIDIELLDKFEQIIIEKKNELNKKG